MSRFRTVKTIASTLMFAAAIGFAVQYGESEPRVAVTDSDNTYNKAPRTLMMSTNDQGQPVFGMPDVVTTPLDHAANLQHVVAVDAVYKEFDVPELGIIMATPVPGCETTLSTKRQPAAVVELSILSPCVDDRTLVVSHQGMQVSVVADGRGAAVLRMPALVPNAVFAVSADNVLLGTAEVFVPELRQYDRAVLQWATGNNMRLHALENGAQIGDPGHVWSASAHTAEDTRAGNHGFVLYLGDPDADIPYQAEVYTFPAGQMNRDGGVDLRVGVTVSAENCGREVDAQTIQTNAGQTLVKTEIAVPMPACDQIGQVAMLRDKFTDLTIASR